MGTRSLTKVTDEKGRTLVTIYRQMDGYPTGMGADLKAFLENRKVINGIGSEDRAETNSNGMGCLAASLVGLLKEGRIGSIYIVPNDSDKEDYSYEIGFVEYGKGVRLRVSSRGKELYDGPAEGFDSVAVEAAE